MSDVLAELNEDLKPVMATDGTTWAQVQGVPAELLGPIRWDHPCAAHHQVVNGVIVPTQAKRKKVCIVGYAENSRHLAWYNDPECEIWGVNQLYRFIPRADRWFQIHRDWDDSRKWAEGANLREWIRDAQCPVYMIDAQPDMPMTVPYPKQWVKDTLGIHEYFTSSIALMIGLAIAEGFEEIGIYGIDLIVGREYQFEKPCAEFFLGLAHARGIKYHLPENSALLWQSHTYGYDLEPDYGFYGLSVLKNRAAQLQQSVVQTRDKVHILQGHVEEAELVCGKMPEGSGSREVMMGRIKELREELDRMLNELYLHDGAHQEVSRMHAILELRSRGGGVKA